MAKAKPAQRVRGRSGLRDYLATAHREGAPCSTDPAAQLEVGGWVRGRGERHHLFGGAAEVTWAFRCQGCRAAVRLVVE